MVCVPRNLRSGEKGFLGERKAEGGSSLPRALSAGNPAAAVLRAGSSSNSRLLLIGEVPRPTSRILFAELTIVINRLRETFDESVSFSGRSGTSPSIIP